MKKIAVLFVLFVVSFSISASDLILSRFTDTGDVFISTGEARDCIEIAPDGYTMPFRWVFYLTDDYAEFRFWWPDGRRMSAPGWETRYTISVITEDSERYEFEGYTPDSYAIRIDGDAEYVDFRNCLYENRGVIEFEVFQYDYRSSIVHSPWHHYEMGTVDISDIDVVFRNAYGESLYIDKVTDPSEWLIGVSIGPSLTQTQKNDPDGVVSKNMRLGLEAVYLPLKIGSFSLGGRADVSLYQKNMVTDAFLFDMFVALYMSNYFFINRGFSMRLEYGIGAGYIHNPMATKCDIDSLSLRIPVALSFIISNSWNIAIDGAFDFVPAFADGFGMVFQSNGGVSVRYGF